ncbi:carbamoyltransferase HypF [Candidatus Woesearchaeota archaeon]|nr:carbamoyltransferase HypF [Candidatus Woesearchaeota archaeon]
MYKFFVKGIVQGVGFRPYIYRKAMESGLKGYVKNIGEGVEILVNDDSFVDKLADLPPLAKITEYSIEKVPGANAGDYSEFSILKSTASQGETLLPADIFMCDDCLRELRDRKNRRNSYYFITCTNCGPRFSMISDYPYDRPFTAMDKFEMCPDCRKEYTEPLDRRYHAQTIACKKCGPKLRLIFGKEEHETESDIDTIRQTADILKEGKLVSIKGIGGFHACSLSDDSTVGKLRSLLNRPDKPFAIMAKDIEMVEKIAHISEKEKELLESPQRPIVILKKKNKDSFKGISELDSLGVMLPYTALHYLMFDYIDEPLAMTSCNIPGEPVAITEKITDIHLTHEREIINRCDDSVIKVISGEPSYLRRSRGFTPLPVKLPLRCKDTIAVGAEMNNVICAAKSDNCFLSQYIGQTYQVETMKFMKQATDKMMQLTRLNPKLVVCDLHPGYNSSFFAEELAKNSGADLVKIQHHKAHVASVAAEHKLRDYVGIAMDGLGFGEDGKIWGGEIFDVSGGITFRRVGHLEEQPQLGGDSATRFPKKMLLGILSKFMDEKHLSGLGLFDEQELAIYLKMLKQGFNVPYTTSTGRVLDAAAALLGLCDKRTYDGRPAMLLESIAATPLDFEPVLKKDNQSDKIILMTTPLFEFLLRNLDKDKGVLAATAQMYLAKGFRDIAEEYAKENNKKIVFSGGVAYNRMISGYLLQEGCLTNKEIPCGDGGICYGQAYLANLLNP